ncbi:MAG: hypothetical protein ACLR56_01915 [Oscillospiraceae bacterium]
MNCSAGINYKIFVGEAYVGSGREQKNMVEGGRGNRALLDGRVKNDREIPKAPV